MSRNDDPAAYPPFASKQELMSDLRTRRIDNGVDLLIRLANSRPEQWPDPEYRLPGT